MINERVRKIKVQLNPAERRSESPPLPVSVPKPGKTPPLGTTGGTRTTRAPTRLLGPNDEIEHVDEPADKLEMLGMNEDDTLNPDTAEKTINI